MTKTKTYSLAAVEYIAKIADGGMRDAITLLDKATSYNENLTTKNVLEALGASDYTTMCELLDGICNQDLSKCIDIIENVYNGGLDLTQFTKQFWLFVLDVYKYNLYKDFKYLQLPVTLETDLQKFTTKVPSNLLDNLMELNASLKRETNVKQYVEATLFSWLGDN